MFRKTTLKNGLRILTVPQKNTQAVTVLALVGTGSKYEKKEISGISHFLEHMFFKGTKKRPSSLAIAEPLDRIGGIYNAFTSQEATGYFAKVEASNFGLAMDWVSDIFLNSILPVKEIEKEKKVITEEINMIYDHPMSYIGVLWQKLLYGDQPAGWSIAGTKESVAKIDHGKLLEYREKQYCSENTIVAIAGNFKDKSVVNLVQKYFSKIKTEKPIEKPKVVEKQKSPQCLLEEKKTDQTHLHLGVRGFNLFHPRRYVQEVLGAILGGMMSSRLFTEIRERLGLAYYVSTETEEDPDTGFLVTQAGVDNQKVEKAILAILKEYKKMTQKEISQSELKKAKDNIKGRMALLLEPSDAQAFFYAGQELLERKILVPKEIFDKINRVSRADILMTAREIFRPERLNMALIGPFKDKEKFQKLLKI